MSDCTSPLPPPPPFSGPPPLVRAPTHMHGGSFALSRIHTPGHIPTLTPPPPSIFTHRRRTTPPPTHTLLLPNTANPATHVKYTRPALLHLHARFTTCAQRGASLCPSPPLLPAPHVSSPPQLPSTPPPHLTARTVTWMFARGKRGTWGLFLRRSLLASLSLSLSPHSFLAVQ